MVTGPSCCCCKPLCCRVWSVKVPEWKGVLHTPELAACIRVTACSAAIWEPSSTRLQISSGSPDQSYPLLTDLHPELPLRFRKQIGSGELVEPAGFQRTNHCDDRHLCTRSLLVDFTYKYKQSFPFSTGKRQSIYKSVERNTTWSPSGAHVDHGGPCLPDQDCASCR